MKNQTTPRPFAAPPGRDLRVAALFTSAVMAAISPTVAETIAEYDMATLSITGTASTSPDLAATPGLTAGGFEENLTGGTAQSEFGVRNTGLIPAGVNGLGARALNSSPSNPWWEFTITPDPGVTIDLNSITLDAGIGLTLSNSNWDYDVSTSIDSFATVVGTFDGPSGSNTTVVSTDLTVDLSSLANQTAPFTIRITPNRVSGTNGTAGQRAGWIDNVEVDATLTGLPDPFITVDDTASFGTTSTTTSLSIPVSNAGATQALSITAVTPGGTDGSNLSVTSSLPLSIPAGGDSTIDFDFTPSVPFQEDYTATLLIASNDSTSPSKTVTVNISNLRDPILDVPTTNFTNNGSSQTYTIDIDNLGSVNDLTPTGISVGGTDASTVSAVSVDPTSIPPNGVGTDAISFTFTPDLGAGFYDFFLSIDSNDPLEPSLEVDIVVEVQDPTISAPGSLDFGSLSNTPGTQTQSLFIENTGGSEPLEVTALNLSGSAFSVVSPLSLPFSIPAGSSQEVVISFDPGTQPGSFSGSLEILSDDYNNNSPVVALAAETALKSNPLAEYSFGSGALDLTSSDSALGSTAADLIETDLGSRTEFGILRTGGLIDGNAFAWSRREAPNTGLDLTAAAPTEALTFTLTPAPGYTVDLSTDGWLVVDLGAYDTDSGAGGTSAYDLALTVDDGSSPFTLGPVAGPSVSTAGDEQSLRLTFDVRGLGVLTGPVTFSVLPQTTGGTNGVSTQVGGYLDLVVLGGTETAPLTPSLLVTSPAEFDDEGDGGSYQIPIQNIGLGELNITSITTDGSGDASAISNISFDTPLSASGGSGNISFDFTPNDGAKVYATNLTVVSNDPGSPTIVALEITVTDPEGIFPESLTMGPFAHNPGAQTGTIVVSNDGELADLVISGAVISSGSSAFTVTSTPGPISPGDDGDIEIAFDPGAIGGLLKAVLTVSSNNFGSPTNDITLLGYSDPAGTIVARYDFDPSIHVSDNPVVDADASLMTNWSSSNLSDEATGTGALSGSNQGNNNRGIASGLFGNYLGFSSARENDAQTPLAGGGDNETTWTTFSTTPDANGGAIDFTGGIAVVDTYAFTSLSSNTAADWTLYFSLDGGSSWTSLGTLTGAATSNATTQTVGLNWDLSPIGNQTGSVDFILDPVSTGDTNGSDGQRRVGFDNLVITAGSVTPGTAGFDSWAAGFGIPADPDYDAADNDGIPALLEYALDGLSPLVSESLSDTFDATTGELSFTKGSEAVSNGDVLYSIETSTDLGDLDPWTAVTPDVDDASTISYALPAGAGRIFGRLNVTQVSP